MISRQDPGIGHLVTFSSFLFVAAHGFVFTAKLGKAGPRVPIRYVGIMSLRKINLIDEHASLPAQQEMDVFGAGPLLRQRDQQHDARPQHWHAAPHDIPIGRWVEYNLKVQRKLRHLNLLVREASSPTWHSASSS